ncbi:MAG: peptide ABC transporter substrate-binding protein [Oscillospiraceae bacterium]|nr:peptide ABC transporter substrate-binding protein [Oscillospiraceae bacterium]
MKNSKTIFTLALALIMLIGVMAGCGTATTEESTAPSAAAADTFDLSVCVAPEPQTIDPALNCAVDGAILIEHFFEGLYKWVDDGSGKAVLALGQAESVEKVANDDGTVTYTFKIRSDAKWSDGKPVTANDFVYSWQRLATPATAAAYSYIINMVKGFDEVNSGTPTGQFETKTNADTGKEEQMEVISFAEPETLGVSAPDDSTFVVTINSECPYFEEICAFPATYPVRQDMIESAGDQWTFDTATYIGNGPYKMSEWSHNSFIKGVQNENYYDAANLGPDSITFYLMDDANSTLSAFNSGTLQFIESVPVDEVSTLLADNKLSVVENLGTYFASFNIFKAPFNDVRVREAFALAIDRNYIIEKVTQTGEIPATGFVPYGVYDAKGAEGNDFRSVGGEYYSAKTDDYEANCEKARQLLAEAGYPNGDDFPLVEYLYNTDDRSKAIGEALQQMWKTELGVTVTLNNQDWAALLQSRNDGDYSICRDSWSADYNDPCSFLDMWYTGNGNNLSQYSNAEYDAAIDAAKAATDSAERMKCFHDAEDILIGQDYVVAPIYFYTQMYMLDPSIKGMYYSPIGCFYFAYTSKAAA